MKKTLKHLLPALFLAAVMALLTGCTKSVDLLQYADVTFDGVTYDGHWSWIYVARNDPSTAKGQHLWQWMAKQSLRRERAYSLLVDQSAPGLSETPAFLPRLRNACSERSRCGPASA